MNKRIVWLICGVNILLVVFLMVRAFDRPEPAPLFSSKPKAEEPPVDWSARLGRVRDEAVAAREPGTPVDWPRIFSGFPRLGDGQWSEEAAATTAFLLETLATIPEPLDRIAAREVLFARLGDAPDAAGLLAGEALAVASSATTGPAERRSALVLLFRLLLRYPAGEDRPAALAGIATRVAGFTTEPAQLPVLIEGWVALKNAGLDAPADELFAATDLRALLEEDSASRETIAAILRGASWIAPDWEAMRFRRWLDHPDPRVRQPAWNEFVERADPSSLGWLDEWVPDNPDIDLLRLRAIRTLRNRSEGPDREPEP